MKNYSAASSSPWQGAQLHTPVLVKHSSLPAEPVLLIRYTYYAFIFSIPFELAFLRVVPGQSTLTRFIGFLLLAVALVQPRLCFRWPPDAFWCFAVYLFVYTILGFLQDAVYQSAMVARLFTLSQMLVLFWVSYNLLRYERVLRGTLLTLSVSCVCVAVLQFLGISSQEVGQERLTAFGDNPNAVGVQLSVGLLALSGLAYGRKISTWQLRLLFWLCTGLLAVAIVRTGSRGAILALTTGLLLFFLRDKSLVAKLKVGVTALIAVGFLGFAAYQIEAVRARWEKALVEGHLAGREEILPQAWEMFEERILFGWGPIHHYYELGARLGLLGRGRDTHNLFLWILTEVGIIGGIPFFAGLWLCGYAAWRARHTVQGILPLAMLVCLLIANMSSTWHNRKVFWVVLAYALASRSYVQVQSWRPAQRLRSPRGIVHDTLADRTSLSF